MPECSNRKTLLSHPIRERSQSGSRDCGRVVHRLHLACSYVFSDMFSVLRNFSQHFEILELSTVVKVSRTSNSAENTFPQGAVGWSLEQESGLTRFVSSDTSVKGIQLSYCHACKAVVCLFFLRVEQEFKVRPLLKEGKQNEGICFQKNGREFISL